MSAIFCAPLARTPSAAVLKKSLTNLQSRHATADPSAAPARVYFGKSRFPAVSLPLTTPAIRLSLSSGAKRHVGGRVGRLNLSSRDFSFPDESLLWKIARCLVLFSFKKRRGYCSLAWPLASKWTHFRNAHGAIDPGCFLGGVPIPISTKFNLKEGDTVLKLILSQTNSVLKAGKKTVFFGFFPSFFFRFFPWDFRKKNGNKTTYFSLMFDLNFHNFLA